MVILQCWETLEPDQRDFNFIGTLIWCRYLTTFCFYCSLKCWTSLTLSACRAIQHLWMIKVRALVYSFGSNMVAKTRKRNGDRQKLHMLDFRLSFVSGLMNVGSSPEQRLVIEPKNSWDRPGAVNHCQYSQTYTVRKCFLRSVQFDRLFSVYFFSLFSFFKERSLSLSEQPQTHLICSYHVAKNVFHQGNCFRIKIKKCKFNANWGV